MPKFSEKSKEKLGTCDQRLQEICSRVIEVIDFTVIYGYRNKEEQNKAFAEGNSKKQYPDSRHNQYPSQAIDIAPYPIDWNDRERFTLLAGIMIGTANARGIKLRWGGDWNMDMKTKDNTFDDLCHFEIIEG